MAKSMDFGFFTIAMIDFAIVLINLNRFHIYIILALFLPNWSNSHNQVQN